MRVPTGVAKGLCWFFISTCSASQAAFSWLVRSTPYCSVRYFGTYFGSV